MENKGKVKGRRKERRESREGHMHEVSHAICQSGGSMCQSRGWDREERKCHMSKTML